MGHNALGWRRSIGCLVFMGHFPQKSHTISGSFAKKDLQLKASYRFLLPCKIQHTLQHTLQHTSATHILYTLQLQPTLQHALQHTFFRHTTYLHNHAHIDGMWWSDTMCDAVCVAVWVAVVVCVVVCCNMYCSGLQCVLQ